MKIEVQDLIRFVTHLAKYKCFAVELRTITWWSLDEITEAIRPEEPVKIRSAVYRTFVREKINTVPKKEREKAKKFKEYDPGYLHMDVTYCQK